VTLVMSDIYCFMERKDEPQPFNQICQSLSESKTDCEEALHKLVEQGKIMSKELSRNNNLYYLSYKRNMDESQLKALQDLQGTIEQEEEKESKLDQELAEIETRKFRSALTI